MGADKFFQVNKDRFERKIGAFLGRIVLRGFIREVNTADSETNTKVGLGYGHARSINFFELIFIFCRIKFWRFSSFIDLGCGDGVMLRFAKFLNLKNIYGIEGDFNLFTLASFNNPEAQIELVEFSKYRDTFAGNDNLIIYAFNPARKEVLFPLIYRLVVSNSGNLAIVLKNLNKKEVELLSSRLSGKIQHWRSFSFILVTK